MRVVFLDIDGVLNSEALIPIPALADATPSGSGRSGHSFVHPLASVHGALVLPSAVRM